MMIAGIRQRLTRFRERIETGDLRLITDDRWLPNPIDDIIGIKPRRDRPQLDRTANPHPVLRQM